MGSIMDVVWVKIEFMIFAHIKRTWYSVWPQFTTSILEMHTACVDNEVIFAENCVGIDEKLLNLQARWHM